MRIIKARSDIEEGGTFCVSASFKAGACTEKGDAEVELKAKTGGQILAVRPRDPDDLPTVVSVVAELVQSPPDVAGQLVTAPIGDPGLLPAVVRRLDDAGVVITELALRGSSLYEVFLSLTGREPEPIEDEEAPGLPRQPPRCG